MRAWANQNHANYIAEFTSSLARAKEASQAWWESKARKGDIGTEPGMINAQAFKFVLASRYRADYAERPNAMVARPGDAAPSVQINYIAAAAPQIESALPAAAERVLEAIIVNGSGEKE
jgi:hypothetical protein